MTTHTPRTALETTDEAATDNNSLAEALFDANVRFDELFWLPGTLADGQGPDAFRDFCESLDDDNSIVADLPELKALLVETDGTLSPDDVAETLSRHLRNGFIAQFATPTMTFRGDMASYSWGHYYTAWHYADTLPLLTARAIKWAEARNAADKAKAGA